MTRVAAPRAGRSLEGLVSPLRKRVLDAVAAAEAIAPVAPAWLARACRRDLVASESTKRAAWAAVAIVLVDMVRAGGGPDHRRAFAWFGWADDAGAPDPAAKPLDPRWDAVDGALAPLAGEVALSSMLPYLLDTYGRTTRLDVIRDAALAGSRAERKKVGSFYTPQDVADFMVAAIGSPPGDAESDTEWWLDPAAGSGVFLAAALRRHRALGRAAPAEFATTRLIGCDISPQACDFAAFVVLAGVAGEVADARATWSAIRGNIVALDATASDWARGAIGLRELLAPCDGPARLICNPPYAAAGTAVAMADGRPTGSLYLPFVEMAWRVGSEPRDAACLVVPLALGANRSADHRRCRMGMSAAGGEWTLLFFDRQPHALFGEEAKTRATIAIRRPGPAPAAIRTSRLLKWTSRQRASILSEARAVDIGLANVGRLVPKLGDAREAALYRALEPHRLRTGARPEPVKADATEIAGSTPTSDVFVAGTAYNFLNVFLNYPDRLSWRGTLSASGIHRLPCADFIDAKATLAVLTSRTAFWLWHVECDGFHVPAWFLSELPLLNLRHDTARTAALSDLGARIWDGLQQDVICSSNRDRLTFAFRPTLVGELRSKVDALLADALGAAPGTAEMLREFERQVVSIDGSSRLAKSSSKGE